MIRSIAALTLLLVPAAALAQQADTTVPRLFREEAPLAMTVTANMKQLRDDRRDDSPYRWAQIRYTNAEGKAIDVPLKVKTHGIWRLKHCDTPPLRFNFANKEVKGTLFHDVEKPKVVNMCHDDGQYEQFLLQEMQLYRVYQVLTPNSHRVRLLRVTYVDSATKKAEGVRYAFLFEDPDELAARLGGKMLKLKGVKAKDMDPRDAMVAFLFEYMIGNTDFSFNGLHNGELVMKPDASPVIPIAYDFDFSGAVNPPYATPDPRLHLRRVRDRLYRGYCELNEGSSDAIKLFLDRKKQVYALYSDPLGKLLDARVVKETLAYFDDFYGVIANERDAKNYVLSGCVANL
jgi:hypothetical protein